MKTTSLIPSVAVILTLTGASLSRAEEKTLEQIERDLAQGIEHPIIKRQHEFGEIVGRIAAKHPDIFIGSQVGDVSTIYLKGEAPAEVRQWVNESELVIRIVDKLPFSLEELKQKSNEAAAILTKAGYTCLASSVEAPHDIWIQIRLKDGQPSANQDILKLLPKDLAKLISLETVDVNQDAPGMTGYVVAIGENDDSFLLTTYEPDKGRLACSSAIWFGQEDCSLKPGQQVQVWFSAVDLTYPGQSSAMRTQVMEEPVGKSAAIRLAMKKRQEDATPGIPYLVSIKRDEDAKQWSVLFASDTNEGKPDAKEIVITDQELSATQNEPTTDP